MNTFIDCRAMEAMCHELTLADEAHSWKWEARAERWHDVGHRKLADHFRESDTAVLPAPLVSTPSKAS